MRKIMLAVLIVLVSCAVASAKTTRKRTYNWDKNEVCYERCTTDSFGNTRCVENCY